MNKINAEDKKTIYDLAKRVFDSTEIKSITRLGGLTNHTYHVTIKNKEYIFRIPGEGTQELIDRSKEILSNQLACALEIDAPLFYMDEKGYKVMEYIDQAITMSPQTLKEKENISLVATVFHTLHTCGKDTGVSFDVFAIAKEYEEFIIRNQVDLFQEYETYKAKVEIIKAKNAIKKSMFAPCHNDPLCENWILSGEHMYLVDWEYAGMNDPLWDLADVSIEAGYNKVQDRTLLECYFNGDIQVEIGQRFLANKIYIDYLWSLWGKTRVPFDPSMQEYAQKRFERMKENIQKWSDNYA